MEGNEIEKAAEESADKFYYPAGELHPHYKKGFTAGANWQKERENKQLRTEIYVRDSLTAELTHFKGGYNAALDTIQQLQSELTHANARIEELTKALQDLVDLQNGPPLPTYEKDFNEVMERCYKLLEK